MKIGIVCPYNILKGGGVQEHVKALQAELQVRGYDAKIVTPLPRDFREVPNLPNVIFVGTSTDFHSPLHTSAQVSATADTDRIEEVLTAEQFDILHFHEPWTPVLSRQILQRSTSINIATFHAKIPETLMSRTVIRVVTPYMKSVLKYLHEFTAVSASAAEYVGSLTDEPITIIPNGIDLSVYRLEKKPAVSADQPKTVLFIGRLERRKGVKYLLNAYRLLARDNPDVKLIIAGDGPDREKLMLLAEDLKLPNVTFLGYISDALKMQLLHEADVFCSPAVYGESFGIVLLEAMATGTAVVAGNNSGYTDVMQGIGALSIVNPHDEVEFARRLEVFLYEPTVVALWQKWATQYVKQFSYSNIVDRYEELYKEALQNDE
jgi:phosphatidyl-myo-inositol alpha-mannosyltransferase